ncbi:MAG: class I SAM-dependent methyltransferase [Thermoplasmata archaeon]
MEEVSFDAVAHLYDEIRVLPSQVMESVIDILSQGLSESESVLEVGEGAGRPSPHHQEREINVLGVDKSPGGLARGSDKGLRNTLLADSLHVPFGDRSTDSTFTVHTLAFVEHRGLERSPGCSSGT